MKDPVCLMDVDENAEFKKEYKEKTYCFCSKFCLERFVKEPESYLNRHKDLFEIPKPNEEEV